MNASRRTVLIAISTNAGVAAAKLVVAGFTGSTAMLAEGLHSIVDTVNESLLLVGELRAAKPPDERHPFGYARELYFWALIVAVVIFGIGGGATILEGITRIITPEAGGNPLWDYIVIAIAFVLESISWTNAHGMLRSNDPGVSIWRAIRRSKDPRVFTVFLEDTAALAGLAIAALGIALDHALGMPELQGYASIAIGLVLCGVAAMLIVESHDLLLGESGSSELMKMVREVAAAEHGVLRVERVLSVQLGPEDVALFVDASFRATTSEELANTVDRVERAVRMRDPSIHYVFIEAQRLRASDSEPDKSDRSVDALRAANARSSLLK